MSLTALVLSALLAPTTAHAQTAQWQLGAVPSVSSGLYGSSTRTEVIYSPITTRRLFTDGDMTLVVPWICVRGTGGVVIVSGTPVVPGTTTRPAADTPTQTRPGAPTRDSAAAATSRAGVPPPPDRQVRTACGLGDVVVRGRYYLPESGGWGPSFALRAHLKAPTASASEGLGTGRPDSGVGVEVTQPLSHGSAILADGGVTMIGKPAGSTLQNTWWYDLGVSQDVAGGRLNVSLFVEEYRAVVPDTANARDLFVALSVRANGGWRLQASGLRGLTDSAPDYGFGLGLSVRF